jgi:Arc/MetJ-type ribon-helix-helix transcriptional regulator
MVRLHEPMDSLIDEWIARRLERPSRPDAIRRLLALALADRARTKHLKRLAARGGFELATQNLAYDLRAERQQLA